MAAWKGTGEEPGGASGGAGAGVAVGAGGEGEVAEWEEGGGVKNKKEGAGVGLEEGEESGAESAPVETWPDKGSRLRQT